MNACSTACGFCGMCTAAWEDDDREEQPEPLPTPAHHDDATIRATVNRAAERSPLTDHLFDTGILLARMGR